MSRPEVARLRRCADPDAPIKGPAFWNTHRARTYGQYPKGFSAWACRQIGIQPDRVLHICSGALREGAGVRVDVRASVGPDVVADGRRLPFKDSSFPAALLDPPYSRDWARDLYGTHASYPTPASLLREARRVVAPGGRIGYLHQVFPFPTVGLTQVSLTGIATGCGFAMRCFVVFEVDRQIDLPGTAQ